MQRSDKPQLQPSAGRATLTPTLPPAGEREQDRGADQPRFAFTSNCSSNTIASSISGRVIISDGANVITFL